MNYLDSKISKTSQNLYKYTIFILQVSINLIFKSIKKVFNFDKPEFEEGFAKFIFITSKLKNKSRTNWLEICLK